MASNVSATIEVNGASSRKWRDVVAAKFALSNRLPLVLLALATFLVWGQTIRFGFVWDDTFFIRDNLALRSWSRFPAIFYRLDTQSTLPSGFLLFRPIRTAIYALLFHLGGKDMPQPWLYHLANVLWHGATGMMLFLALKRLSSQLNSTASWNATEKQIWAFLIAMAFLVHPVVSEVVCWAKSLDDILAAFFVIAALHQLLDPLQTGTARWRALLFFALAMYSKESAVPFVVVPFIIFRWMYRLPWRQCLVRTIPFLIVTLLYMVHRHCVIGRTSQTEPISGTYGQTMLDMLTIVPKYFRLLLGIGPFTIDYNYLKGGYSWASAAVVLGALMLLMFLATGIFCWRARRVALIGFGLCWLGLFLLPVSNLIPMMQYMAERFLYLPLVGWLIALGAAIVFFVPARKTALVASLALILIWAGSAWNRSWIWQDAFTLFIRSSQEAPQTWRIRENAMFAILELPAVRDLLDSNSTPAGSPGSISPDTQKEALNALDLGCRLFPQEPAMLSAYGTGLARCGSPADALPYFEKAAQLETNSLKHLVNLARVRIDLRQFVQAKAALDKAAALGPDDVGVLQLKLKYDWLQQDYSSARQVLLKLNKIAPSQENDYWLREVEKKLSPSQRK